MLMQFTRILLGLLGLGIVVFVHELGHFIAARAMGIGVEAFSIGWGKPFLKKKIGEVEYRLGIFPLGGYCKMKDEGDFEELYRKRKEGIELDKGSYFAAHPVRRIVTCFSGPLFNFIFAILVFSVIWGIGFEVNTLSNRIVLASEIIPGSSNPADEAGLLTGDRIISIAGKRTETFHDIQEIIATNPGELLALEVERNGLVHSLYVRPLLDRNTGAGRIGVYFWTDPVIERVSPGGAAERAGLESGDIILKVNGNELPHTMALHSLLSESPSSISLEYLRDGTNYITLIYPTQTERGTELGIMWEAVRYQNPRLSIPRALVRGTTETWKTLAISIKSLSLLFSGIDISQAVSGPVRITYMVGDVATEGFSHGFGAGISSLASFLALISIALCMMNLLPLPILDGGMILLFIAEGIIRKPLNPRFVSVFQAVGVVIIAGLMIFAVFGDIRYFVGLFGGSN